MSTIVWAFQRLDELQGATGFVECDDALAAQLIADGRAQDPQVGGSALKQIEGGAPRARRAAVVLPPSPHEDAPPPPPQTEPQTEPTHTPLPPDEQYDDDPPSAPPIEDDDDPEPEQSAPAEYETKVVTPKRRASVKRKTRR